MSYRRTGRPPGRPRVTRAQFPEFVLAWQAGLSINAIADQFGVSRDAVFNRARKLALPARGPARKLSAEQIAQALRMREGGMTLAAIAKQFSVHPVSLRSHLPGRSVAPCAVPVWHACPRCGGRSSEIAGHGICALMPQTHGVDRRGA